MRNLKNNDKKKRAMLYDKARILFYDKFNFKIAQQELRAFDCFKKLSLGKTRVFRIADLPNIEHLHFIQILKKY